MTFDVLSSDVAVRVYSLIKSGSIWTRSLDPAVMKHWMYIVVIILSVVAVVAANRNFRSCDHLNCRANRHTYRCCRIGGKLAKRGYDCTVDTVIATQRYKLSFRQKTHFMSPAQANPLIIKVKKCQRYGACLECCCKHRRKSILNLTKPWKYRQTGEVEIPLDDHGVLRACLQNPQTSET